MFVSEPVGAAPVPVVLFFFYEPQINVKTVTCGVCFGRRAGRRGPGPSVLVVALLEGAVLPEVVERLQLPGHELAPGQQLPHALRVLHRAVLLEGGAQPRTEVVASFGIVPAQVEQLRRSNHRPSEAGNCGHPGFIL